MSLNLFNWTTKRWKIFSVWTESSCFWQHPHGGATISYPRRITSAVLRYVSLHGDRNGSETPFASSSEGKNWSEMLVSQKGSRQQVLDPNPWPEAAALGMLVLHLPIILFEGLILFSLESVAAVDRLLWCSPLTFSCCGLNLVIGSATCALLITTKLKN